MDVEEWFDGYKVDILARTKEEKAILVELGEISDIGKYYFPDMEGVKEFWFGDKENFIYRLSRKEPISEESLKQEAKRYSNFIADYYKKYCNSNRLYYHCMDYQSAYNCSSLLRELNIK